MAVEWAVGVDVGASLIKGADVDVRDGSVHNRREEMTPAARTPAAIAEQVADIVARCTGTGAVGVTVPGVVRDGVVRRAANLDPSWADCDPVDLFRRATGRPVFVVNDADAAGIAEAELGAAGPGSGQVLLLTLGTGIGSALLQDGLLVPWTEFGHLPIDGRSGEHLASAWARIRDGLDWPAWAARVNRYLAVIETILEPDLLVLGGSVSGRAADWGGYLEVRTPWVPARFFGDSGLVGAALHASNRPSGASPPARVT